MRPKCRFIAYLLVIAVLLCCSVPINALDQLHISDLQTGMVGEDVKQLQQILAELSFYRGRIDGIYGSATTSAVRRLQRILGVQTDGWVGRNTLHAFNQSVEMGLWYGAEKENDPELSLKGKIIGIDAGHQQIADQTLEPVAPATIRTKPKMSEGGIGVKTGVAEYEVNLQIAKKLQVLLEQAGATVVMSRTENDVSLSNIERAQTMNENRVDCWIRIHCNYSANRNLSGISVLTPDESANASVCEKSFALGDSVLKETARSTNAKQIGVFPKTEQTGFNWSRYPVIAVELGFLSNPTEDVRLNRPSYQSDCARGILHGIAAYFAAIEPTT